MIILQILFGLLFCICAFTVMYSAFYAVAGFFYKIPETDNKGIYKRIAVLIPAYKEDAVILNTARKALFQEYPSNLYDVAVIADSLQEETINELKQLPLIIIPVNFEKSSKSKALNKAFEILPEKYDIAVILDADNIMKIDFLTKINTAFISGHYAIQGHRTAKNDNTKFAVLDGISEEANNHMMRKGQVAVGFSSAIIGSGMAFSYTYLKQVMANIDAVGGFDKELELQLIRDGHKICYLENAIVLDEKVQKAEVFANQRTRWISAQLIYLRKYWMSCLRALFTGKWDYANKVMHYMLIPKVLLMGFLFVMSVVSFTIPYFVYPSPLVWTGLALLYYISYAVSIPLKYYNRKTLMSFQSIPVSFLVMIKAMFKLKGANKKFIHTPHSDTFNNQAA